MAAFFLPVFCVFPLLLVAPLLAQIKWADKMYEKGEYANALASLEYAEGWLDAGKRLGIFK